MEARSTDVLAAPPRSRNASPLRAWADLSLRSKLLLFALGLVTLPGVVFALVAFSGARAALEREVGIQLQQTAERGADALAAALERTRSDARSWASQDVMRDLLVGDLDKRVSRLLRAAVDDEAAYLAILCIDDEARVVAASSGEWLGRSVRGWGVIESLRGGGEAIVGPTKSPDFDAEVLEIGVPITNPDPPGGRIGFLVLVYDWGGIQAVLDGIRLKLAKLEKHVAAIVVDRRRKVIGGVSFDGQPAQHTGLAAEKWESASPRMQRSRGAGGEVLIGAASVSSPAEGWWVLFLERTAEALAPVAEIRSRWILVIACILVVGLAVAVLLARQFMRPLNEVTRATADVASHPELGLPLLPVRSRNEVGQLTESFNKMTAELKRSQEEALAGGEVRLCRGAGGDGRARGADAAQRHAVFRPDARQADRGRRRGEHRAGRHDRRRGRPRRARRHGTHRAGAPARAAARAYDGSAICWPARCDLQARRRNDRGFASPANLPTTDGAPSAIRSRCTRWP